MDPKLWVVNMNVVWSTGNTEKCGAAQSEKTVMGHVTSSSLVYIYIMYNHVKPTPCITGCSKQSLIGGSGEFRGANMGPLLGRQDPGGPYVGPIDIAIWDVSPIFRSSDC